MAASNPNHNYWDSYNLSRPIPAAWTDPALDCVINNTAPFVPAGSLSSSSDMNSPVSVGSFPYEQYGVVLDGGSSALEPEMVGLCHFPYCNNGNNPDFEPYCCNETIVAANPCVPDYYIPPHMNWCIQDKPAAIKVDDPAEVKIGKYSVEERKNRILRYLQKRNQRNFNKTIKYACRKTLADKRVRIRGRFAKNNETPSGDDEDRVVTNSNIHASYEQNMNSSMFYEGDESIQMIYQEEEEWFHEAAAMACFPYSAG